MADAYWPLVVAAYPLDMNEFGVTFALVYFYYSDVSLCLSADGTCCDGVPGPLIICTPSTGCSEICYE